MDMLQGWYSTGFGYGTWVGILMVSGFQVVPIVGTRMEDDSRNLWQRIHNFSQLSWCIEITVYAGCC